MTDRMKKWLFISGLLGILLAHFAPILFTHKIIRAPDIINEFYWGVKDVGTWPFWSLFRIDLSTPVWNMFINSGYTTEGGDMSGQFLFLKNLIFWLIPPPASVAWYIVLQFFIGSAGICCYCRQIGASRWAALLGGLVFALAPENTSLINAGHVMKIATISFAPWAFYFLEKGLQTRRTVFFLSASVILAYQFFHTHWQIAYYTCLAVGIYGICRLIGIAVSQQAEERKSFSRLFGMNIVLLLFFLTTVSISLFPLANWSKETNRGVNSGAVSAEGDKPKGGLDREEAMMWSLPPEELGAFIIPGMFGLSRQEAGENPSNIRSYYWGRMVFTQTVSYMGLLPWLLLPLTLIFRRDKYTWLALGAIVVGVLFSMGKYTPFYNFLFDYFPGINRFRVPKMIMFIPVMGLGVIAARGIDILLDEKLRSTRAFRRYITGMILTPLALLLLLGAELIGREYWINRFIEYFAQPTRYEQGPQLIMQRWNNLVTETGITAGLAALFAGTFYAFQRKMISATLLPVLLIILFLADVGRINSKFMFLVDEPHKTRGVKNPETDFLAQQSKLYRVLPMDGRDPMQYVSNDIPVMFTSNAVQQRRWQEFLDNFNIVGPMPDMLNVKYLIVTSQEYQQQGAQLGAKYTLAYTPPDGGSVILENRKVLPKGWLVAAVAVITDPAERLAILQNPQFNPATVALVETPPPLPMANLNAPTQFPLESVAVNRYEGERIEVKVATPRNALLVLGEKYSAGWKAHVNGTATEIVPVNHVLRGVYLPPGNHLVEFVFDPLPFKIGKYLTLGSFALFIALLVREVLLWRRGGKSGG